MGLTVGLLGDVMLGRGVADRLAVVDPAELWEPELRELVRSSCDLVVCNLECCISDRGGPTDLVAGKPFFFRAPPQAAESLRALRVDAVGVANNHALDYGETALADTLDHLRRAGIATAGAGRGLAQAQRGAIVEREGAKVGLLAVSDHPREFAAGDDQLGIAWADLEAGLPEWLETELSRLRDACDLVIAFPHWGPNMSVRPAGWQRARARELLAAGADLVAGHSAHVFHGVEHVADGLVLYDLGDALDDYAVDPRLRNDLGVLALWRPGHTPELELIGLRLEFAITRLARGADADWIAARLERACAELGSTVERVAEQRFAIGGEPPSRQG